MSPATLQVLVLSILALMLDILTVSIQRKQLAMALEDHQQRITNQAIENDLARQRLVLAERDADRSDALAQANRSALWGQI